MAAESKAGFESLLARHRQLAPTASVRVSPLCLGAMTFGSSHAERYGEISKEAVWDILDHFFQSGGNFIDTANIYHEGESEEWLGQWMAEHGNRDEIVLATKYANPYKAPSTVTQKSNLGGNGLKTMRLSIEASLKRLQTSYIDIFYVHFWDYTVSVPELMQGLNDLVTSGKVNYLGISDAPAWVVTKANQSARDHGLRQFVVYQGFWTAALRDFERDIIPMCLDEGMALAPYGTLNQGRFQTEEGFKEREQHNLGRNSIPLSELDKKVSKILEKVSNAKGVNILNVALAYILQKAPYVFAIVGGRKVDHIMGSVGALGVKLTKEEMEEVESAYAFDYGFPHSFLSGTMFDNSKSKTATHPAEVWLNKSFGEMDWVEPVRPINRV